MKRKRIKTKNIILCIIIFVIIVIAFFSYSLKNKRELNKFEAFIKDTTTSAERIILWPFNYVIKKIDDYKELNNIRKKYEELLPNVDRIDSLNAENIELRKELKSMKEELNIKHILSDYEYLNATVICFILV